MLEIRKIIDKLNETEFLNLKHKTDGIIRYFFVDVDLVTKEQYCDKVYDYIDTFLISHRCNLHDLMNVYTRDLLSLLNTPDKKLGKRAGQYLAKAKELSKQIKVDTSNLSLIQDFTRCFACLYMAQTKNRKVVDEVFSFNLKDIDIELIGEDIASLKELHTVTGPDLLRKRYSNMSFCSLIMFIVFSSMLNRSVEEY